MCGGVQNHGNVVKAPMGNLQQCFYFSTKQCVNRNMALLQMQKQDHLYAVHNNLLKCTRVFGSGTPAVHQLSGKQPLGTLSLEKKKKTTT